MPYHSVRRKFPICFCGATRICGHIAHKNENRTLLKRKALFCVSGKLFCVIPAHVAGDSDCFFGSGVCRYIPTKEGTWRGPRFRLPGFLFACCATGVCGIRWHKIRFSLSLEWVCAPTRYPGGSPFPKVAEARRSRRIRQIAKSHRIAGTTESAEATEATKIRRNCRSYRNR